MLEVLNEPFVQTARAKGASALRVLFRHVLRNALLPVVTILGIDLGLSVSVAMFIEVVFGLPGLGASTLGSLNGFLGFDLPFVTGILLVIPERALPYARLQRAIGIPGHHEVRLVAF